MKKIIIMLLFLFTLCPISLAEAIPTQPSEETAASINYEDNYKFDWEDMTNKIVKATRNGVKKAKYGVIAVMSTLFAIQLLIDGMYANANGNLKGFIAGTVIKKGLVFALYVGIINMILAPINSSRNIIKMIVDIIFRLCSKFTGVEGVEKISNVWLFGKTEAMKVMKIAGSAFTLKDVGGSIVKIIILLIIVGFIYFVIFKIMLEAFVTILQMYVAGTMSVFFMPLGILDYTKQIWNIGRFYSMLINSGIKLMAINIFLITGMKVLEQNTLNMQGDVEYTALFGFLLIVYVIYELITKGVRSIVSAL